MLVKGYTVSVRYDKQFYRPNIQQYKYCIVYLIFAKKVELNYAYHTQKSKENGNYVK